MDRVFTKPLPINDLAALLKEIGMFSELPKALKNDDSD